MSEQSAAVALPAHRAGPVLRGGDAAAVVEALREDNPDKVLLIDDHGSYVRVEAEGGLILRRATLESVLGRPFRMHEIEILVAGFSGKIETDEHFVRWYFKHAR